MNVSGHPSRVWHISREMTRKEGWPRSATPTIRSPVNSGRYKSATAALILTNDDNRLDYYVVARGLNPMRARCDLQRTRKCVLPELAWSHESDYALARAAANGVMAAIGDLYVRHNRRVYALCLR